MNLSIRFILFGLMAPFAAALHNRFGLRNVTLSALVIVATALVVSLMMTKPGSCCFCGVW